MRLVAPDGAEQSRHFANFAAQELGVTFAEPFLAFAVVDARPVVIGAIVMNNYDGNNIDLSGVGLGAFTPSVVRGLADYVFHKLGCSRVTLKTRRSNKVARKLLGKHFHFEATLKGGFGSEDAFQFRMCRDECPWLKDKPNG